MDPLSIVAAIQAAEAIIAGAMQAYDAVKTTLSSSDLATVQAALDAAATQRQADVARVTAELSATPRT